MEYTLDMDEDAFLPWRRMHLFLLFQDIPAQFLQQHALCSEFYSWIPVRDHLSGKSLNRSSMQTSLMFHSL